MAWSRPGEDQCCRYICVRCRCCNKCFRYKVSSQYSSPLLHSFGLVPHCPDHDPDQDHLLPSLRQSSPSSSSSPGCRSPPGLQVATEDRRPGGSLLLLLPSLSPAPRLKPRSLSGCGTQRSPPGGQEEWTTGRYFIIFEKKAEIFWRKEDNTWIKLENDLERISRNKKTLLCLPCLSR